eukprot:TRINITY_DN115418_c0_g1_i1.p1 TRINITY_DN115418_c0_g1~~TRINITY_DN115418_c0_g1_i1.p1  ORF type:complete len:311 (-),score=57.37 TRINITY_DN115418_c0_g1_i1:43-975(-)
MMVAFLLGCACPGVCAEEDLLDSAPAGLDGDGEFLKNMCNPLELENDIQASRCYTPAVVALHQASIGPSGGADGESDQGFDAISYKAEQSTVDSLVEEERIGPDEIPTQMCDEDQARGTAMTPAELFETGTEAERAWMVHELKMFLKDGCSTSGVRLGETLHLDVDGSLGRMDDVKLEMLASRLPKAGLKSIDINLFSSKVSDQGLEALAKRLPKRGLKELALICNGTLVTDAGIKVLAENLPKQGLQRLVLYFEKTAITNEGVDNIAENLPECLQSLEVWLWNSSVSHSGRNRLRQAAGRCGCRAITVH